MATKSANKKHRFSKKSKNKEDESFSGKKTLRSVAISSKRSSDVFSASQEVKEPRVNEIECRDALIDYFNQKSYDWESKAEQFEKKEVEYMMRKNGKRVSGICGIRKGLSDGSVGNSLKSSLGIDDSVVIRKDNESSFMESSLRERCKSLDTSATKIHQISIRNSNKRHSINNVDDESEYNSKASKGNLKEEAQKVAILRTPQKNRKKKEDGLVESFKKSLDEKAISKDNLKSVKAEKYPRKVEKEKNKKSVEANKKNSDANTRIQDDESNVKLEKSLEKVVKERKKKLLENIKTSSDSKPTSKGDSKVNKKTKSSQKDEKEKKKDLYESNKKTSELISTAKDHLKNEKHRKSSLKAEKKKKLPRNDEKVTNESKKETMQKELEDSKLENKKIKIKKSSKAKDSVKNQRNKDDNNEENTKKKCDDEISESIVIEIEEIEDTKQENDFIRHEESFIVSIEEFKDSNKPKGDEETENNANVKNTPRKGGRPRKKSLTVKTTPRKNANSSKSNSSVLKEEEGVSCEPHTEIIVDRLLNENLERTVSKEFESSKSKEDEVLNLLSDKKISEYLLTSETCDRTSAENFNSQGKGRISSNINILMSKKSSSDENQNNSEAEIDSNILENKNIKKSKNEDITKNMEKKIENKELKSRCANDDAEKKAENENVQENLAKNREKHRFENIKRNSKNNQNLQPIDFKNKKLKKTSQKEYINFAISDNINNIEEKEEEMKILENEEGASQSEESVEEYIKLLKDALRSTDPTSGFVYDVFTENPHVKIETNRLPEETLDQNCRFLKVINKVCQRENVFEKLQAEEEQFKKSDLERRVFNDKENEVYERYKKLILSRLLQKITGKTTEEKLFLEKMNLMLETNFKEVLETSFLGSTDGPKKYPLLCLIECFKEQKEKEKCVLEDRINANPCVVNDDGTLNSLDPCNEDISHESVQPGGLKGYENFVSLQDKVYQEAREDKKLREGYKENSLLSMVEKIDSSNINNLVTNIYPDVSGKFINQTKTTFAFQHNPKMVDLFNIKKDDNQKEKISIFDKPYNLETSKSAKNNDSEKCQFLEFQNNKNNANLFVVKNKLSKNSSNTAFTNIDTSESQSQSSEYDQCEFLNPLQKKSKNKNDETTVSTFSDEKFNKESILLKYVDGVFHEIGPGNIIISMFKNNNRLTFVRKNIHMFSFDVLLTFDPTPRLKDKYTMCFMISGKGIYALRFKDTLFLQQFHNILNKCIDEFRQTHKTEKEIAEENQKITEENDKNNNFLNQGEKIVNSLIFCENNEEKHVEIKEDQKNKIKDKEDNYKHQN